VLLSVLLLFVCVSHRPLDLAATRRRRIILMYRKLVIDFAGRRRVSFFAEHSLNLLSCPID